jgi:hypothetical protein
MSDEKSICNVFNPYEMVLQSNLLALSVAAQVKVIGMLTALQRLSARMNEAF